MRKIKLLLEFYKSLIFINLVVAAITLIFAPDLLLFNLTIIAIVLSVIFKEYYRNDEYYFYFNNNISKTNLYSFCLLANIILITFIQLFF